MRSLYSLAPFLLCLQLLALSGCGGDSGSSATAIAASQQCIGCHESNNKSISPVTGARITDEWARSAHSTASAAGCRDCHGPSHNHPESCGQCHGGSASVTTAFKNPDEARQCENCHGLDHPLNVMMTKAPQHFGNMTASITNNRSRASYVSSNYVGKCRSCHNPHDPTSRLAINKQWASSGHGDLTGGPRTSRDFKTYGTYQPVNTTNQSYCVRCHTTTGYINFVTSGFTVVQPFAGPGYPVVQYPANSADKTKEPTACNACHDDGKGNAYGFKLREVSPLKVYYNYSNATKVPPSVEINDAPIYYPDAGPSNLCVPCHSGRGVGNMIKLADAKFLNFSAAPTSISAHSFPGASVVFKVSGYEYPGRDYTNPSVFVHDKVGINNVMNTGNQGPCITCHMKSDTSHSYMPVQFTPPITGTDPTVGTISAIISSACSACHNGGATPVLTPQSLQTKRAGFQAALASLNALLNRPNKKVPGTPANWERLFGHGSGPNTMGASFNYNLLKADWGAYVHNDVYAKRLIYDSIDWLYDGQLDGDVEAAINSITTATSPWSSATTYTSAQLAQMKIDAINYLLGSPGGSRP